MAYFVNWLSLYYPCLLWLFPCNSASRKLFLLFSCSLFKAQLISSRKHKLPTSSNLKTQRAQSCPQAVAAAVSDTARAALSATDQGDRRATWSAALPLAHAGEATWHRLADGSMGKVHTQMPERWTPASWQVSHEDSGQQPAPNQQVAAAATGRGRLAGRQPPNPGYSLLTWGFWNPLVWSRGLGESKLWLYDEDNPSTAWCQACFSAWLSFRDKHSPDTPADPAPPPSPSPCACVCVCVCVRERERERSLLQTLHRGWDMNSKHPISFHHISLTAPHIRVRGLLDLPSGFCSQAVWLLHPFNPLWDKRGNKRSNSQGEIRDPAAKLERSLRVTWLEHLPLPRGKLRPKWGRELLKTPQRELEPKLRPPRSAQTSSTEH